MLMWGDERLGLFSGNFKGKSLRRFGMRFGRILEKVRAKFFAPKVKSRTPLISHYALPLSMALPTFFSI